MISSHELARMLLAHRDTNLTFEVLLEEYDKNDSELMEDVLNHRKEFDKNVEEVFLRDDPDEHENAIKSEDVVTYDSFSDSLIIKLGTVAVIEI
jgi:hypothetical protein